MLSAALRRATGGCHLRSGSPTKILGEERFRRRQKAGGGSSRHPKPVQNLRLAFGRLPSMHRNREKAREKFSRQFPAQKKRGQVSLLQETHLLKKELTLEKGIN